MSILTTGGQAKLLGYWLMYLSVPAFYVGLSKIPIRSAEKATESATNRAQMTFLTLLLFGIVPVMMAWFSTRPSIYATKTSTILGLVGVYVGSWLVSSILYPKATAGAINPNEKSGKLAAIHASCCGVVAIVAMLYIALTGNALVNGAKIGGMY